MFKFLKLLASDKYIRQRFLCIIYYVFIMMAMYLAAKKKASLRKGHINHLQVQSKILKRKSACFTNKTSPLKAFKSSHNTPGRVGNH